jgi:hypothetical protein
MLSRGALNLGNRIVDRASALTAAIAQFRDFETNDGPGVIRAIDRCASFRRDQSAEGWTINRSTNLCAASLALDEADGQGLAGGAGAKVSKVQQSLFRSYTALLQIRVAQLLPAGIMIGFAGRPIGRAEENAGGIRERCHQIRFMLRG